MKLFCTCGISLCLVLALTTSAAAAVPASINVQGRLTDADGTPIGGVEQRFDFKIFDSQSGNVEVWPRVGETGERHVLTPDAEGLWTTQIGTQYPINADHFVSKPGSPDSTRWLQITVEGTLLPRVHMTSAPFSVKVGSIDGALGGDVYGNITLHSQFKVGDEDGDAGRIKVTDGSATTITLEGATGDLKATGKASIGPLHTISGLHTFVAGYNNTANGNYATVTGNTCTAAATDATVGGGSVNGALGEAATIGGGTNNFAGGPHSTIGGGLLNNALSEASTIGGGASNEADSAYATVGGGINNNAGYDYASVLGGSDNAALLSGATVSGGVSDTAFGVYSTIGGGRGNSASDSASTVGGGSLNVAAGDYSVISGGRTNLADSQFSTIGGGQSNHVSGKYGTIGGGVKNTAGKSAFVGGGNINEATGTNSVISGGWDNAATGAYSMVGGGAGNLASGTDAAVPGGKSNWAEGERSLAAGAEAHALHDGTVVISAKQAGVTDTIHSSADGQMVLRAQGQFYLTNQGGTAAIPSGDFLNTSTGAHLTTGGVWTNSSDANAKENFRSVDPSELLARLSRLPIREWNYKVEDDGVRHIGPTAQDFYALFGVGTDDKSISTIDPDGIALVAIKELHRRTQRIAVLESRVEELSRLVEQLMSRE